MGGERACGALRFSGWYSGRCRNPYLGSEGMARTRRARSAPVMGSV
jgi:hypothetical protein